MIDPTDFGTVEDMGVNGDDGIRQEVIEWLARRHAKRVGKGGRSKSECGKLGGARTIELYGREHMTVIGQKGGTRTVERYGENYMSKIGRKGGEAYNLKYVVNGGHPWSVRSDNRCEICRCRPDHDDCDGGGDPDFEYCTCNCTCHDRSDPDEERDRMEDDDLPF